jgi:hypothetical protein
LVVADLPPKAAPQPMPAVGGPVTIQVPPPNFTFQTAEPRRAVIRSTIGAGFHGLAGLLCRAKEVMVAVVTAPVTRLRGAEVHREFHLFHRR